MGRFVSTAQSYFAHDYDDDDPIDMEPINCPPITRSVREPAAATASASARRILLFGRAVWLRLLQRLLWDSDDIVIYDDPDY